MFVVVYLLFTVNKRLWYMSKSLGNCKNVIVDVVLYKNADFFVTVVP